MEDKLTDTIEDYLKAIFNLTAQHERATTNQLAERLGVTAASVTGMFKRLAACQPPLVEYHRHRGVVLTKEGEKIALEIIRHHRLLELFLHRRLGYSWDEVHGEAERLEHVISEDMEERIARELGDPLQDPHGHPIPTRELAMPPHSTALLSDLRTGQSAVVQHVGDAGPDFLRYLDSIGLVPGARVEVLGYSPYDQNLSLHIHGRYEPLVLGAQVTTQIYIEIQP